MDAAASFRRVLVVLPAPMIARNWLATSIAERLGHCDRLRVTIVTPDHADRDAVEAAGLQWRQMLRGRTTAGLARARFYLGLLLHLVLAHRFNAIAGFRGSRERLKQSWSLRRIAFRDGLAASRWFGRPFPRSRRLYGWLSRIYHGRWQRYPSVEALFDEMRPALLVLGHVQNHFTTPYALAAHARGVPILGMTGSWDQPTTKGPLNPGLHRILAQSRRVADELVEYHGVERANIDIVGWPQMDLYRRGDFEIARGAQLDALGLPAHFRYVLMGAYQERLGRHEPELCRQMAAMLAGQGDCALVIRCHPIEPQWRERFGRLHRPPHVVVLPPELGNFERLANQIRHAEIVLSSAGTILLDAIALDTPAIAIALEDESEPYFDRVARRYDMEHWAALVKTGGLPLARSPAELASLIVETLADRQRDAAGRARLVAAHLDPLDGRAAERIVAAIVAAAGAQQARAEAAAS